MLNKHEISILKFLKKHIIYSSIIIRIDKKNCTKKELKPYLDDLLFKNLIIRNGNKYKITDEGLKQIPKYSNKDMVLNKIQDYKDLNKPINLSDIARDLQLTRQAVSYIVKKHNINIDEN